MAPQQRPLNLATIRPDAGVTGLLVLVDADNTLWDTDGVFAQAQVSLLCAVESALQKAGPTAERLEYVRSFDQALAEQHHLGLRYPPRLLIDAMAFGLQGLPQHDAVRRAWNVGLQSGLDRETVSQIEQTFFEMIAIYPSLLHGVSEGLRDLASVGATTVVFDREKPQKGNPHDRASSLGRIHRQGF